MVELDRTMAGPQELAVYLEENPAATAADFDDNTFSCAKRAIKGQRNTEQGGLCVYCEQELSHTAGHVEHIKPRSVFPSLSLAYENLAHSCEGVVNGRFKQHCGHLKDNFVRALEPESGCNRAFGLSTVDGHIVPAASFVGVTEGNLKKDIKILGLNASDLAHARNKWLQEYVNLLKGGVQDPEAFLAIAPFRYILATV